MMHEGHSSVKILFGCEKSSMDVSPNIAEACFSIVETINTAAAALKIIPESYHPFTSTAASEPVIFKHQRAVFHSIVLFLGHGRHFDLRHEKRCCTNARAK